MIGVKAGRINFGPVAARIATAVEKNLDLRERQDILVRHLEPVGALMKQNVPRLTGQGAESIEVKVMDAPRVAVGAGGWDGRRWRGLGLLFTEYGYTTPAGRIIPARPVMRAAWESMKDRVREGIAADVAKRIKGAL